MSSLGRLLLALALAGLAACNGGGGDGDAGLTGRVGPEGGTLQIDGLVLSVPEGALNDPVTLNLSVSDLGGTDVPGRVRVGRVFRISPDTVRFLLPATVKLAWDPALLPERVEASEVDVRHTDYSRPTPERLGSTLVDAEARTVSGETLGTGSFWPTAPEGTRPVTLTVTPETRSVYVGETAEYQAEVRDQNGALLTGVTVTWEVSNKLVASVAAPGQIKAVGPGSTKVVARVGTVQGSAALQVASAEPYAKTFQWENPVPGADDLYAVRAHALGLTVAGSHGLVAAQSQGAWTRLFSAPLVRFRDLGFTGAEVVAVGARLTFGVLVRSDGKTAQTLYVPDTDLLSLWLDGEHGMAVGEGPNLAVRGADGSWTAESSPVTEPLLAVDGVAGEPVVVGARGAVYRRSGEAWISLAQAPLSEFLVRAVARGEEAWGVSAKRLWHFQAGHWTALPLPAEVSELTNVTLAGETLVVVGRDDRGRTVVLVEGPGGFSSSEPGGPVNAVTGSSPTALWAVGPAGSILAWDGKVWTSLREGPATDILGLAAFDGPKVFAVTNGCGDEKCETKKGAVLERGTDGRWAQVQEFSTELRAVGGRSATDLWAVGNGGKAYHLTGAGWSTADVTQQMGCVFTCHDGVHACGSSAILVEKGGAWTVKYQGVGSPRAASCSPSAMWIVGDYSSFRVVGGKVEAMDPMADLLLPAPWRAVFTTLDGQAFLAGDARYLLHWTGEKFVAMDQPANVPIQSIRALWGTGAGNLWAGGVMRDGASFLIHFNGAFWQPVDPGMDAALGALTGIASGDLWIGGASGSLVRGFLNP